MKIVSLIITSVFIVSISNAQKSIKINIKDVYSEVPVSFKNLPPEDSILKDVDGTVRQIKVNYSPASADVIFQWNKLLQSLQSTKYFNEIKNIEVQKSDLDGFNAYRDGDKLFVFYNNNFYEQFKGLDNIDLNFLILFSLAHELSHFINRDVYSSTKSKESESNADYFACRLLCSLNDAEPSRIKNVINLLAGASYNEYYPNKGDRLKAIDQFFKNNLCEEEIDGINIRVGAEVWRNSNADVAIYSNGEKIPEAHNHDEWIRFCDKKIGCWCYYNFDAAEIGQGKLYNRYAVEDLRSIAPKGWRVPKKEDWLNLQVHLNDLLLVKLKSSSGTPSRVTSKLEKSPTISTRLFSRNLNGFAVFKTSYDNYNHFLNKGLDDVYWSSDDPIVAVLSVDLKNPDNTYRMPPDALVNSISKYDYLGLSVRFIKGSVK